MSTLVHELGAAARRLRRQPVFSAAVVLTLGLALGANTAIFTVVHAVLLSRLPFAGADRLVVLHSREPENDAMPFSIADFLDMRSRAKSIEGMAAWSSWSGNLTGVDQPIRLSGQFAT